MIVEALIGGVTVCFCASLRFAKWCVKHEAEQMRAADPSAVRLANLRSVREPLEKLFRNIASSGTSFHDKEVKDKRLRELTAELEKLSKQEAAILRGEA
jgi:hypothetical protein